MLLAGDVGGTKTNLAVFSPEKGPRDPLVEETFPSGGYASLQAVVSDFLSQVDFEITQATFGVAGPVVNGRAKITNLPWKISQHDLGEALGVPVRLLNDLESIANAVPFFSAHDLETLKEGQPKPHGAIAVIAPGTGLGEAFLTWNGERYQAHPSEGGHASFAPVTPVQMALLRYLADRLGHVSWERVCSGQGIPNIYHFLRDSGRANQPDWLAQQLAEAEDDAPIISQFAFGDERACEICETTLAIFASILAAEAGNLALKVLSTGGIYLGGGIPPRILPALKRPAFMDALCNKGRLSDLVAQMPVHVILNPKAALLGAAGYGLAGKEDA